MSEGFQHYINIADNFLRFRIDGNNNNNMHHAQQQLDPTVAKEMGIKLNELTSNPSEVDRFCLGVTFLSWPFLNEAHAHPMYKFLSVTAAKKLLVSTAESVVYRITRTRTSAAASSKKKGSSKGGKKGGAAAAAGAHLTLDHFHRAVDVECGNCCFLRVFDAAAASSIPDNTRRIIQFCVGALLSINCALGDRSTFTPGNIPWPAFHRAFIPILEGGAASADHSAVSASITVAWEFLNEFVSSFQEHGVALPNLVGYAAELMKYGIEKRVESHIGPACANFCKDLVDDNNSKNSNKFLSHLFQAAAQLCNMSPSSLVMGSQFDRGGGDRKAAADALATFIGACAAVTDAVAEPLAALLSPLPLAMLQLDRRAHIEDDTAVPSETFELLNNALECLRGLLARENGMLREQSQRTFAASTSLFLLVGAMGRFAPSCRDEVWACACTAMTAITEMLDNAETQMFDSLLGQALPPDVAAAAGEQQQQQQQQQQQGGTTPVVGEWFLKRAVVDWLVLREADTSTNSSDAFRSIQLCSADFGVEDSEKDVLLKLRSRKEKSSSDAKKGEQQKEDGGEDDEDDQEEEEDMDELAQALAEDGVARSPTRNCVLELIGALATALPCSTAPVVFRVCSSLIEEAGPRCGDDPKSAAQTEAAAVLEAAFVALSEIIDETFPVLRQQDECMASLVNNVFRVAATPFIAQRPGVMAASLRLAGMVAVACATAAGGGEVDMDDDDDDKDEDENGNGNNNSNNGSSITAMNPDQLRVVVSGAETMLRHIILRGVNSPFKRCNWAAINTVTQYVRVLGSLLFYNDDDDDDDDDDEEGERVIRAGNNNGSCVPKSELRSQLFPAAAEDALFEILFASDGANWVNGSEAQQQVRRDPISERGAHFLLGAAAGNGGGDNNSSGIDPLPVLQLLSRSLTGGLLKYFVTLDVRSARFYEPKQRSQHLAVPRFARRVITCIRRGWASRPAANTMELNLYVEILRHMAPALAIPFFDESVNNNGGAFLSPLEMVAADIREACVVEMNRAVANATATTSSSDRQKQQKYQTSEWRDTIVSMMCDTLSDISDGLLLSNNRLVALQRMGERVQLSVPNPAGIVNPGAAQLVLTDEVMVLASTLAEQQCASDLRRVAFALLADFAAAHCWWRSLAVVSSEAEDAAHLPVEDKQGTLMAEQELPPPCVAEVTPAMQRLQGFCDKVLKLCVLELERFVGYDPSGGTGGGDDDDGDEELDEDALMCSVANSLWCLSQWFVAAAGPPQHTAAVAQSCCEQQQGGGGNPNADIIARALPMPPEKLLGFITMILARIEGVSHMGTLRDNALLTALRLATLFPRGLGPLTHEQQQPISLAQISGAQGVHNVNAYMQRGLVAAAIVPVAASCVPRLQSNAERQEALQRIGALATAQLGPGGGSTFMLTALQQMPASTVELAAAVQKEDLASTVGVWSQIIHFVAAINDSAVQKLLKDRRSKLKAAFGLKL